MGFGDNLGRDILHELALCLQGVLAVRRETEPFADAEDMGIYGHGRLVPDDCADDVGGLATDSLKCLEILDIIRHDTVVCFYKALRHGYQMFRFGTRITDGLDVFEYLVRRG